MKKSLLIAVAALMVAMGANAQGVRIAKNANWLDIPSDVKLVNVMKKDYTPYESQKSTTVRRAGETGLDGEYILNGVNFKEDFTESTLFTLESKTGTITLDQYEGTPSFEYNVVLHDFSYTGAVVYGKYDAEAGVIEIPVQTIYTHATYKEIVISGGYRSGAQNVGYGKEIFLIVNKDGTMDIDEDIEEEGDVATTGWVSFLPNYEDGGLWNYGFDITVLKPNATMKYRASSAALGGTGSGWSAVSIRVAIEDYKSEWVVNYFLTLTPVSVTLNNDGSSSIPLGVKMYDYDRDEPYGMFRLVGVSDAGDGYISRNYEKELLKGFWENGYAEFFKVVHKEAWDEEDPETHEVTHYDEGDYYVTDDDEYFPYVAVATANDEDGAAYQLGYACYISIETDEHAAAGINEVKANGRNNAVKAYNLMGQEVSAAAKGLIIRDGKKFVNK